MSEKPNTPLRTDGYRPRAPNCVTIFGAGIAGLTAAHELIERGFRVQIWEPVSDQRDPRRGLAVGGMARTQWGQVPWLDEIESSQPLGLRAQRYKNDSKLARNHPMRQTQPIVPLINKFYVLDPKWSPGKLYAEERSMVDEPVDQSGGSNTQPPQAPPQPIPLKIGAEEKIEVLITGFTTLPPAERVKRVQLVAQELNGNKHAVDVDFDVPQQLYFVRLNQGRLYVPLREPSVTHPDTMAVLTRGTEANEKIRKERQSKRPPPPKTKAPAKASATNVSDDPSADAKIYFFINPWVPGEMYGIDSAGNVDVPTVALSLFRALYQASYEEVYVEVTTRSEVLLPSQDRRRRVDAVLEKLKSQGGQVSSDLYEFGKVDYEKGWLRVPLTLKSGLLEPKPAKAEERTIKLTFVQLADVNNELPKRAVSAISFRARERWLPGEHGHRFFPAFYHHLFDTMKRTPILETVEKPALAQQQELAVGMLRASNLRYIETGKTTFENLRPTTSHALAFTGHRPSVLTRTRIKSFQEFRELFKVFFSSEAEGGFDADPRDTSFFTVKLFQYLTSSPERRKDYESMSWWEFIEGEKYGESFKRLLQKWPQALVAMNAKSADARTNGTTTVQIMLDMVRDSGYRDGILAGPTNEAWLEHWRRYLEAQGVEFIQGQLEGFELKSFEDRPPNESVLWPKVTCFEPRHPLNDEDEPELLAGYFLLALPAYEMARIAKDCMNNGLPLAAGMDLARAAQMNTSLFFDEDGDPLPMRSEGESEFRHYAGIQFYFEQDVLWLDGQVYHPNSAWGLTTVSQARFWDEKMDWEHGYRGVLSVIIADWEAKSPRTGKSARDSTPQELAEEVWAQVKDGLQGPRPLVTRQHGGGFSDCPEPIFWHLDDNLQHRPDAPNSDGTGYGNYTNASPFHIQPPRNWQNLPGELDGSGYSVENGIVVCGMYTKTHTRIPSMEAANESARHAVNAILRHSEYRTTNTPCDIWDPETREVDDFAWLKEWDARLKARGQPHFVEIFGLDRLVRDGLRGGAQDPFDPVNLAWSLGGLLRRFRPDRRGDYR